MAFTILQWNAQSFNAHGATFSQYLNTLPSLPHAICIQETWFQPPYIKKIKGYTSVCTHKPDGTHRGGSAIYLHESISYSNLKLHHFHQSVGVQIDLPNKKFVLISIYTPESILDLQDLDTFLESNTLPLILCGDFDSHNTIWGSTHTNHKGNMLWDFIENHDLVLLNDGHGTRICQNGTLSPLDLTFVSPALALQCQWSILESDCGSDHFPIKITLDQMEFIAPPLRLPRWNLRKANWEAYQLDCNRLINDRLVSTNVDEFQFQITSTILAIAGEHIPKVEPSISKPGKRWWNDQCKLAIRAKKKAYNRARRTRLPSDYCLFKQKRAIAHRITRQAESDYWKSYCSSVTKDTPLTNIWKTVKKLSNSHLSR